MSLKASTKREQKLTGNYHYNLQKIDVAFDHLCVSAYSKENENKEKKNGNA